MTFRVSMVGLLLAGLPGLAACGTGQGFAGEARDLPGVRDARVDKRALDTDYYGYTAIVDMEKDATRDEIAGALDALSTWYAPRRGDDDGVRLYLGGGTTELDDEGSGDSAHHEGPTAVVADAARSHAGNVAYADLLLHATRVLAAPVTIRDYEWTVTTDDPDEMLRRVLADPGLAAAPGLHLAQPFEGFGPVVWRHPDFSSTEPLTREHLRVWEQAQATAKLVREGKAMVTFVGSDTATSPRTTDKHPGAIDVRTVLRLPGLAGPKALAADPTADPRWPVVAAQLDLLKTLPEGSSLSVDLEWGRAPEGGADNYGWLVSVTNGRKVALRKDVRWNAAAAAYLAR